MASDGVAVKIPVTSLVQGSQAPTAARVQDVSGKVLPPSGNSLATPPADALAPSAKVTETTASTTSNAPAVSTSEAQTLVAQLNKALNDSGRPDQYRVDPSSSDKMIQQINPANGAVVGEFLASEFPALARSVGVSGALFDSHA
ncbi:MAG: hypothetical protein ABSF53_28180 [Terracidiphilus sp.]|jgi:hypothetical protein